MLQAVEGPGFKLAAVAGAVLALGLAVAPSLMCKSRCDGALVQRLVLHAPERPNEFYISAWHDGDVVVRLRDTTPRTITFKTRAFVTDGCEWLATERLVPSSPTRYEYSYDEEILACKPGAIPTRKTPRTGYVTVAE